MKAFFKKIIVFGILISCMFVNTGCESKVLTEKIDAGMNLIEEFNYEEANNLFEEVLNETERKDAYRGQGIAYIGLGEYVLAIQSFQKALASTKGGVQKVDYDINYYLALAYYKNEEFLSAKEAYTAILQLKPKESEALFLRGKTFLHMSELENALEDFDKYLALDSKNLDHYIAVYESMDAVGYDEEGAVYLHKALSEISKLSTEEQGTIYYYLGDYEQAKEFIEAGKNKKTKEIALILGKTYEALGAETYAISVYLNYLETDETCAEIYNQLAICKSQEENYEEALNYLKEGYAYADVEFLQVMKFNEVVIQEYAGKFTNAKASMKAYLSDYPGDEDAILEYEFLKSR